MLSISYHTTEVHEDVRDLLQLAKSTALLLANLVEDSLGPVMQLESIKPDDVSVQARDMAFCDVQVTSTDGTLLVAFTLTNDWESGWEVMEKQKTLVDQYTTNVRDWLESVDG